MASRSSQSGPLEHTQLDRLPQSTVSSHGCKGSFHSKLQLLPWQQTHISLFCSLCTAERRQLHTTPQHTTW